MKLKNKLIPLVAGLALLCPLAIYQHNANASEEATYYNNSSYNNQTRQPYSYYDDEAYINSGSTAGTYDNNYTGSQPHDSEVRSALDYLHKTSNEDLDVQYLSGDKVPERMEYSPDPVDLKIYYYGYDSANPNKTSLGYSVSDYQFNKGDTVNMNQMIKLSGDSTVNILKHPNNFVITKNTLISIPVSQQVNAMINVTPITQDGGYAGPEFSINHLQPGQNVNLSKYLEANGYNNPINKNYIITVPDNISDGMGSNYKVPVGPNNFNPDEIEPGINHSSSADDNSGQLTTNQINNEMSKADQPYTPSYASDVANLSASLSSEDILNSYSPKSNSQSSQSLNDSYDSSSNNFTSNYSTGSDDSYNDSISPNSNNYSNYSPVYNHNYESPKHINKRIIKHRRARGRFNKRLNRLTHNIIRHGRKRIKSPKVNHKRRKNYRLQRKQRKIRYKYISKRRYRNLMKYRKNLYHKSRRLRHRSKRYKHYKEIINRLNRRLKHLRIRK